MAWKLDEEKKSWMAKLCSYNRTCINHLSTLHYFHSGCRSPLLIEKERRSSKISKSKFECRRWGTELTNKEFFCFNIRPICLRISCMLITVSELLQIKVSFNVLCQVAYFEDENLATSWENLWHANQNILMPSLSLCLSLSISFSFDVATATVKWIGTAVISLPFYTIENKHFASC